MNRIETKIIIMVSGRLARVPDSDEKMDLIEELSENLYQRYLDLTADGLREEEALAQTMDSLGDVDELLAYLREVQEQQQETESSFEKEEEEKPHGKERGRGFSLHRDWERELDGLGERISSTVSAAMDATMDAVDSTWDIVRGVSRQVKERCAESMGAAPEGSAAADAQKAADGQEETADDPDAADSREAAAADAQDAADSQEETADGQDEAAEDGWTQDREPRTLSIQARDIHSLECRLASGDVLLHIAPEESDEIILSGDISEVETLLRNGTLQIRQGKTASAFLQFRWGMRVSSIELTVPAGKWEKVILSAANGDVRIDGDLECGLLSVQARNGDFCMDTLACEKAKIDLYNGDVKVAAAAGEFQAETRNGDIAVGGNLNSCRLRTASGDISFRGSVAEAGSLAAYSISGDIDVQTELLPEKIRLSSTSGDCALRIPKGVGFRLFTRSVRGSFASSLPLTAAPEKGAYRTYLDGGDREITISTVSGDISLYAKETPPCEE